ncbi:MAG: threonine/serine exporter family protein [Clostridia bacterium]|nr:threonine/serine exporter family protein [Clostridia bacterium]
MEKSLEIIMDISEQMLLSGAEISRIEESILRLGEALGAKRTDAFIITSNMEVSLHDENGVSYTQTRRVPNVGTDIEKLHRLNALIRKICYGTITHEEIEKELKKIKASRAYSFGIILLAYALIAGAFTLFFGGSILEAVCSAVISLVLALIVKGAELAALNKIFSKFFCSFASALLAFVCLKLGIVATVDHIIIGNIMLIIPGVGLTVAIRDLFVGDNLSGALRSIEVVLFAFAIAGGYFLAAGLMGGVAI